LTIFQFDHEHSVEHEVPKCTNYIFYIYKGSAYKQSRMMYCLFWEDIGNMILSSKIIMLLYLLLT